MEVYSIDPGLLEDPEISLYLPPSAAKTARNGTNYEYLDILARLLLVPKLTIIIFHSYEQLVVDLCNRWEHFRKISSTARLAAIARLLHLAPYLATFAEELLFTTRPEDIDNLQQTRVCQQDSNGNVADLGKEELRELLLAFLRLLKFDNATFAKAVSGAGLPSLLHHEDHSIRYLAVQVLCQYLHAADAATQALVRKYVTAGPVAGPWEGKDIDYFFLP
jgi:midasin